MFCCFAVAARAEVVPIAPDPGLPDKYITAICKDRQGRMWIGTQRGLCRYDGYHFLPFTRVPGADIAVGKLVYDPQSDILWTATEKALVTIRCSDLKITGIYSQFNSRRRIADMCLLPDGTLYAACGDGMLMRVGPGRSVTVVLRQPDSNFVTNIEVEDPATLRLTVLNEACSYRLHLRTGQLQRMEAYERGKPPFMKRIGQQLLVRKVWSELRISDPVTGQPLYNLGDSSLRQLSALVDVFCPAPGRLYILGWLARLYRIDLDPYRKEEIPSEAFKERSFICAYLDDDKVLWIGTNKGLIKVTGASQPFEKLLFRESSISVRSLAEDENGQLFAGTYSGLFCSDNEGASWTFQGEMIPHAMTNVAGRYLYCVGEKKALDRIDKKTRQATTGFYRTSGLPPEELGEAYTILEDRNGLLWIGTMTGLAVYDPRTNVLSAYQAKGFPEHTLVRCITSSRRGTLFVGTNKGLYEIDSVQGVVWEANSSIYPALTSDKINYAREDRDGNLWLCTEGSGIAIISPDHSRISVLKTEDGLSDNTTYQLLWQGDDRVWISTFNGLSVYNPSARTFCNYYMSDGLPSNEFNHNAFLWGRDGRMYFGTIDGLVSFDPDSITDAGSNARLFASAITKWDNRTQGLVSLATQDTNEAIVLYPSDHSLTFNLALTDYHNPERNIFRYRIRELFNEWVTLSGQQAIRLDGLAAGDYTLEVKALDNRGTPAVNTLQYRIEVRQLFFKSWWFYLLLFVGASGLIWGFFSIRLHHLRGMQRMREQIASDLHDEVGSLLTSITMTSDNLRYAHNSERDKMTKLQRIAALSRTAVSSMNDVLWSIDARNDYTGNLADRLREHAEELLLPLQITLHFDFNVNQRKPISSHLRQQLYLIYKEAINNIARHSTATDVWVNFHYHESGFRISIANNGFGTKAESARKGQGLKNMVMRAARIHATVKTEINENMFIIVLESGDLH